jgi:uncharacterized protein (DUF952 family)
MGDEPGTGGASAAATRARTGTLYHIARDEDWARAQARSRYEGGALCRRDGFIHFSTRDQLAGTLARFFAGADGLVLLMADARALASGLRWEAAPDGRLYPHYYGALPVGSLACLGPIGSDKAGGHVLPLTAGAEAARPGGGGR